ncbi:MAG TPA: hypothetical protein DDW17_07840 [Deltaproteobacteria bacterium]|nr:hypothetical protein [Deltaproteobacteria bacterium]
MRYKLIFSIIMVFMAGLFVTPVYAENTVKTPDPNTGFTPSEAVFLDVFVLRPAGLIGCAIGLVGTVISAPFVATSQSGKKAYRGLLEEPFAYTFKRPIGQIDY